MAYEYAEVVQLGRYGQLKAGVGAELVTEFLPTLQGIRRKGSSIPGRVCWGEVPEG